MKSIKWLIVKTKNTEVGRRDFYAHESEGCVVFSQNITLAKRFESGNEAKAYIKQHSIRGARLLDI